MAVLMNYSTNITFYRNLKTLFLHFYIVKLTLSFEVEGVCQSYVDIILLHSENSFLINKGKFEPSDAD